MPVYYGGNSNDTLTGSTGSDTLHGYGGSDLLRGDAGADTIYAGSGNDRIDGGAGNDRIDAGNGDDVISLTGSFGADSIIGGDSSESLGDVIDASTLTSALGVTLTGSEAGTITGAAGSASFSQIERFILTGQDDILNGTASGRWISVDGGAGDDSLTGGSAGDILDGGAGADRINGGAGSDQLSGGDGSDTFVLTNGFGDDTILGGEGGEGPGGDTLDASALTSGIDIELDGSEAGEASQGSSDAEFSQIESFVLTGYADTFDGTDGAAAITVDGGAGNDQITGGSGADSLEGGAGSDRVNGGAGHDRLGGGDGTDTLDGGTGDDTLAGGAGADQLWGGTGNDVVDYTASDAAVNVNLQTYATSGGHAAGDSYQGIDGIIGSAFNDTLIGFDQAAYTGSDIYSNVLSGGAGDDYIDGRANDDILYGGDDNDTVLGGSGNDSVQGDAGNDSVAGGTGNDWVSGGQGDDSVTGDDGDDTLQGDAGNDSLSGGAGSDQLFGGEGDDLLDGGTGSDTLFGGTGNDLFTGAAGDHYDGGENAGDNDTLDLTGKGPLRIIPDSGNPENGTVQFLNANGDVIGTMTFANVETVVPCFTPGARILTRRGEVPVHRLRVGDRVKTRDRGMQTIRWIGRKVLGPADLAANPALQPVRIARGALGGGLPLRALVVSPQHRMLISGAAAELMFGEREVLVAATHLVGLPGITRRAVTDVTYIHVMFDRHEVICAEGTWTESLQPGDQSLTGLGPEACAELFALFPELAAAQGRQTWRAARMTLRGYEARALAQATLALAA